MRRILVALTLLLGVQAHAQSLINTFWLDPYDVNTYAEFTRREYRIAAKQDGPKLAAQITNNQRVAQSATVNTPKTGQTVAQWWKVSAPEWWNRVTKGVPGSSPGQGSQNHYLTKLFMGLDTYQRARATLRATALMYQTMKGLRFEVDAWQMMKNLLVIEEGYAIKQDGTVVADVPRGAVSISVVPQGKENWRQVVEVFHDSPWDDPNHNIKWKGPTSLAGFALEANEVGGDPMAGPKDALTQMLERIDSGARVAAMSLATVQLNADQRRRDALNDAFSPRRLAGSMRILNARILQAYQSSLDMRAILEGRNRVDLDAEYQKLVVFCDEQAKAATAQAEMTAKLYQDLQGAAANATAELEIPERLKVIAAIEKEYEALFNLSSKDAGLVKDIDSIMQNTAQMLKTLFPALAPYVGGVMIPVDTAAVIKGSADIADNDAKDPRSDIQAAYRDARVRALAIRLNWILWEELRGARRLAVVQETVETASIGLYQDNKAYNDLRAMADAQLGRSVAGYRSRLAQATLKAWGESK